MSQNPPTPQSARNFGLDVLRAFAMSLVLMVHGYVLFFVTTGVMPWNAWASTLDCLGVFAVEWFFVLSGFLIGGMLIRGIETQGTGWAFLRNFWLRRWFRTLPNFYLFLVINAALAAWGLGQGRFAWRFAAFAQGLAWPPDAPLFFSEAWSLAVEEWFYFLLPLLLAGLAWLGRKGNAETSRQPNGARLFWMAAVLLIAVPTLVRCLFVTPPDSFVDWDQHVRRVTLLHLDTPVWGVLAAAINRWHPRWWARRQGIKALLGLAVMLLAWVLLGRNTALGWHWLAGGHGNDLLLTTAPGLGIMLMLPWLASLPAPAARSLRWVRGAVTHMSDWTYSLYLSHLPILSLLLYGARQSGLKMSEALWWLPPLWLALTFAVAASLFRYFERPATRLREHLTRMVPSGPFDTVLRPK